MKKSGFDNRASVRKGRLGPASRILSTMLDEVTVDSHADARLERDLKKLTSIGSTIWALAP